MLWILVTVVLGWLALTLINTWRVYTIERRWKSAFPEQYCRNTTRD